MFCVVTAFNFYLNKNNKINNIYLCASNDEKNVFAKSFFAKVFAKNFVKSIKFAKFFFKTVVFAKSFFKTIVFAKSFVKLNICIEVKL